jgi:hypothetical protein
MRSGALTFIIDPQISNFQTRKPHCLPRSLRVSLNKIVRFMGAQRKRRGVKGMEESSSDSLIIYPRLYFFLR